MAPASSITRNQPAPGVSLYASVVFHTLSWFIYALSVTYRRRKVSSGLMGGIQAAII